MLQSFHTVRVKVLKDIIDRALNKSFPKLIANFYHSSRRSKVTPLNKSLRKPLKACDTFFSHDDFSK